MISSDSHPEGVSELEHKAMEMTGELMGLFSQIAEKGEGRDQDLREIVFHIHGLQRALGANYLARAHPEYFRPLGAGRIKKEQ